MASVQGVGGDRYKITLSSGKVMHVHGSPGQKIIVQGQTVTLPAAPAYIAPFLTPEEQVQYNQQLGDLANQEIDLNFAVQQAHANYERTIADIARNALVATQNVEENMAARGQYDSGLRSGGLVDVQAQKALQSTRASEDLRAADNLYEAKRLGISNARSNLQNWYTVTAGQNAGTQEGPTAYTGGPLLYAPNRAQQQFRASAPPPAAPSTPGGAATKPQYQGVLPPGTTHYGRAVPATNYGPYGKTYASGPPPGPDYKWDGVRWVKRGG